MPHMYSRGLYWSIFRVFLRSHLLFLYFLFDFPLLYQLQILPFGTQLSFKLEDSVKHGSTPPQELNNSEISDCLEHKEYCAMKPNIWVQVWNACLALFTSKSLAQAALVSVIDNPEFSECNDYHTVIPSQSVSYFEFYTPNLLPSINIILCNV